MVEEKKEAGLGIQEEEEDIEDTSATEFGQAL
jgi:hypothetical protein